MKDAERKRKHAHDLKIEYLKKQIDEEAKANGSVQCSRKYAEACINDAWKMCKDLDCFADTCECRLKDMFMSDWNPDTQDALQKEKDARDQGQAEDSDEGDEAEDDNAAAGGGGGGGGGMGAIDVSAAAIASALHGLFPPGGTSAPTEGPDVPIGPTGGPEQGKTPASQKGGTGVHARDSLSVAASVSVDTGSGFPSAKENKTVAPSDAPPTTGEAKPTQERKPTVTPDDSSTTGTDAATTKRDCTDCAAALNSLAGGVGASLATMQGDLDCLWAAASRTTGPNGRPLTEGLDRSQIDAGLAALAAGKGVVGAVVLEQSVKKAMIDLIDTLAGRCRKAVGPGRRTVAPGAPPVIASPPPPPPPDGDFQRAYAKWRSRDCKERLRRALAIKPLHKRLEALQKMYDEALSNAEFFKLQAAAKRAKIIPTPNMSGRIGIYQLAFAIAETLRLYCGEELRYTPGDPGPYWKGMPSVPCDDSLKFRFRRELAHRRSILLRILELEVYMRVLATLTQQREKHPSMRITKLQGPDPLPTSGGKGIDERSFRRSAGITGDFLTSMAMATNPIPPVNAIKVEDPGFKLDAVGAAEEVGKFILKKSAVKRYGEKAASVVEALGVVYSRAKQVGALAKAIHRAKSEQERAKYGEESEGNREYLSSALGQYYGEVAKAFSEIVTDPLIFADAKNGYSARRRALAALEDMIHSLHRLAMKYDKSLPKPCQKNEHWHTSEPPGDLHIAPKDLWAVLMGEKSAKEIAEKYVDGWGHTEAEAQGR